MDSAILDLQIQKLKGFIDALEYQKAILCIDDIRLTMKDLILRSEHSEEARNLLVSFLNCLEHLFLDLADTILKETSEKRLTAHYRQKLSKASEMLKHAKSEEDADLAIDAITQAKNWFTEERKIKSEVISQETGPVSLFWKLWVVIDDGVSSNSFPSSAYENFSASIYGIIATALKDPLTFHISEAALRRIFVSDD